LASAQSHNGGLISKQMENAGTKQKMENTRDLIDAVVNDLQMRIRLDTPKLRYAFTEREGVMNVPVSLI